MLSNVAPGPASHISPASMNAASTRYCTIEVTKLGLRNTYINPVGHSFKVAENNFQTTRSPKVRFNCCTDGGLIKTNRDDNIFWTYSAVGGVTDIDKEKRGNPSLCGWFIVNAQWTTVSHKRTSQSNWTSCKSLGFPANIFDVQMKCKRKKYNLPTLSSDSTVKLFESKMKDVMILNNKIWKV